MDLKTFTFPKNSLETDEALLQEAIDRGFYNGHTPYNELFSTLFFRGGTVDFKPDLDEDFMKEAWSYVRQFMGSWSPKHEEKEAICALIFSELLNEKLSD